MKKLLPLECLKILNTGMLQQSFGGEVIFLPLHHFFAPIECPACKPQVQKGGLIQEVGIKLLH